MRNDHLVYNICHYILAAIYCGLLVYCVYKVIKKCKFTFVEKYNNINLQSDCSAFRFNQENGWVFCRSTIVFFSFLIVAFGIRCTMFVVYIFAKDGTLTLTFQAQQALELVKILPAFFIFTALTISLFACIILLKHQTRPRQELIKKYKIYVAVGNFLMYIVVFILSLLQYQSDHYNGPSFVENPSNSFYDIALQYMAVVIYLVTALFLFVYIIISRIKNKGQVVEAVSLMDRSSATKQEQKTFQLENNVEILLVFLFFVYLIRSVMVFVTTYVVDFDVPYYDLIHYMALEVLPMVLMIIIMKRVNGQQALKGDQAEEGVIDQQYAAINVDVEDVDDSRTSLIDHSSDYISMGQMSPNSATKQEEKTEELEVNFEILMVVLLFANLVRASLLLITTFVWPIDWPYYDLVHYMLLEIK
ncbi:hypothetical protein PPL_09738 [Heterostelium album PN500]|uniref:THH1/TOM1/TOM3 domain-containing protein n=1 Tax=Heterostelium pallidum (strain ATCC 26659 / Pp 5 / PN500) TaxID=670386 RepID=D3BNN5_HETP5|nr:hypothetical protein PPL_09738 [Heterostelium album PN500]EFA76986.1 hypothetical protein PPL_09738 [Heterostelium album PN500]|eukprot:XP_020429117.1 hypothetical protein PPL_09738 [Heterostelium album PN500]